METTKDSVGELIAKKDRIESEIKELIDVLETQNGVGMDGHLVDEAGYPRNDIDVYAVRIARNQVIRLQNDHKTLMNDIEKGLHALHAKEREQRRSGSNSQEAAEEGNTSLQSFAEINSVARNSPAEQAGLCVGDKLVQFGSISSKNFRSLQDVSSLVQFSIERNIRVCVLRSGSQVNLTLTPRHWEGRGLLGCNIVPSTVN